MRFFFLFLLSLLFFFIPGCGNDATLINEDSPQTITILEYSFVPSTITAAPGEMIYFYNQDSVPHHILNESNEGLFDNTGLFDSEIIPVGKIQYIVLPEEAAQGSVYYYYDDILKREMVTPSGLIQIEI